MNMTRWSWIVYLGFQDSTSFDQATKPPFEGAVVFLPDRPMEQSEWDAYHGVKSGQGGEGWGRG